MMEMLTRRGIYRWNVCQVAGALGMIGSSIYLLAHYFQTYFPQGPGGDLCDISGFFSCDAVAYSAIATIFTIPISLFGLLAGLFLAAATIFPSEKLEGTNRLFVILNGIGSLLLFIYSLFFLGHLCPVCTLYYLFSWLVLFAFIKGQSVKGVSYKVVIIYGVITIVASFILGIIIDGKDEAQNGMAKIYAEQFSNYPNLGKPAIDSSYRNYSSTEKFDDAPIRITIFSDFQCPACSRLAKSLKRIEARYAGKMNIQFFFYPLDPECNPSMMRSMHPLACKASYLAACAPKDFAKLHDLLFEKQRELDDFWLDQLAKKYGVYECMNDPKTREKVVMMVEQGDSFNLRSTPTMLINGVKIEGVLPLAHLYAVLDQLVTK